MGEKLQTVEEENQEVETPKEENQEVETPKEVNIDKDSYIAISKAYKGGYLDGMIAGLFSAGYSPTEIAEYVGAEINYVELEILYFRRSCEDSEKMNESIIEYFKNKESGDEEQIPLFYEENDIDSSLEQAPKEDVATEGIKLNKEEMN